MNWLAAFLLLLANMAIPAVASLAADSGWVGDARTAARLIAAVEATGSGSQLDAGLQIRLAPGWHAYWRTPGDAGVAPSIEWDDSRNLADAAIAWPAPSRFSLDELETQGYEDGVTLPIAVTLKNPGEALHLQARLDYAVCKDICVPYNANLTLTVPAGFAVPGSDAALIAAARDRVPGDLAAAQLKLLRAVVASDKSRATLSVRLASTGTALRAPDAFVEGLKNGSPGRPYAELSDAGRLVTLSIPIRGATAATIEGTPLRLTVVDGHRSVETIVTPRIGTMPSVAARAVPVGIVGLALLGGLVLNLMPCVLPVLSLKLLALLGYAEVERRQARLGLLATAAGLIVSFGVLAGALIVLKATGAAIGWGIQFQQPWFLASMALVTTLFAASLWGWVPIALPGAVVGAIGAVRSARQIADAFLMGAFATLLAASCTAPFVGTALGFALARGPLEILLVFGALGLGMSAPFLAAAAWPPLVGWLPRPGPWTIWLRGALGLVLLGTAAWLLFILTVETGLAPGLVTGGTLAILLIVLAWRQRAPLERRVGRRAAAVSVALAAVIAVLFPSLHGLAVPSEPAGAIVRKDLWRPYDATALQALIARGKIVFVDVSAAWCLMCKANELAVLEHGPVADRLRDPDVVAMRADWTRPDTAITTYLQSLGRYGVPLDVVYGPGAPAGIALPELLTPDVVMDAFRRAATSSDRQQKAID
jgi:suppressor for copper-sensitivity B